MKTDKSMEEGKSAPQLDAIGILGNRGAKRSRGNELLELVSQAWGTEIFNDSTTVQRT